MTTEDRRLRFIPASEIEPRPAPWPHFPHCPACHRRVVAATARAARAHQLPHFDGIHCPHCHHDLFAGRTR